MPRKGTDWQQTGFRANRELLNRFRSKVALKGKNMGGEIEAFMEEYLLDDPSLALSLLIRAELIMAGLRPEYQLSTSTQPRCDMIVYEPEFLAINCRSVARPLSKD